MNIGPAASKLLWGRRQSEREGVIKRNRVKEGEGEESETVRK